MPTTLAFKPLIDLPEWRPIANAPAVSAAGTQLVAGLRNNSNRGAYVYMLVNATPLWQYDVEDDWMQLGSPGLTGTFGAGAGAVMMPTLGPRGVLAGGNTTKSIALSTALPAAVAPNQLVNKGNSNGFKIRIIGNSAGGSGKTEHAYIVGNTGGTTPTIYLDAPLSFTPQAGDAYEIRSCRLYMLSAGTLAAGCWKYYDIATNSMSANLATTNLPATLSTDSSFLALDEAYVPFDADPGDGYFGNLTTTATAATSITGTLAGGDAAVLANEYRNFQIRIVQDTVTPTAVGQRRNITSHTAGASPVYTVPAWTVTPDPYTGGGRFAFINASGLQRCLKFDVKNRVLSPAFFLRYPSGTAAVSQRMSTAMFVDGATKLVFITLQRMGGAECFEMGTIRDYRVDGRGPQFLKLNGTTVRYRISALRTYLDAQPAGGGPVDPPMQRRRRGRPRKAGGSAA